MLQYNYMAEKLDIQIKDLTTPSSKYYFKSFIFEPKPNEGKLIGVFGIEIEDKKKASKIFEEIVFSLKKIHQGLSLVSSFEDTLNTINEALAGLAQKGEIDWIGKLNSCLLAVNGKIISVSCTGKAKALLFRKSDLIDISEGVASKSPSPLKTFTNVISGSLENQDKLILSTSSPFEFVPLETTKKIFLDLPLDLACSKLKNILGDVSLSLVVLMAKKVEEIKEIKRPEMVRYPSLEIEDIKPGLATKPSLITKEKLAGFRHTADKFIKGGTSGASLVFKKASGIIEKGKPSWYHAKTGGFFIIKWEELKKFFKDFFKNFHKLPRTSKTLFLAALVILVIFCASIFGLSCKRKETARLSQYENLLVQAKDKEKAASDALIYKDEDKAKALLIEAKDLVDKILKEKVSQEQKKEAEDLLSKIQSNLDKAENIVRITEPQVLANFEENQTLNLQRLIGSTTGGKEKVYSFDSSTNTIVSLDEEAKQLITLPIPSVDTGHLNLAVSLPDKNKIVFYTDTPAMAELNLDQNKLSKVETDFAVKDQNIKDISTYMDKIYLLDAAHNQIYKHSRTISGYSKGQAWLNKEINLENAQSLAIDGNIWVLTSDGTVLKFLAGDLQEEFSLKQLAKPLDNPTQIKTSLDIENLYIVDPKNKRVVVFDKKGILVNQYVSDSFSDLKDIYVNEKEGKMYLLSGKKILEINLEKTTK